MRRDCWTLSEFYENVAALCFVSLKLHPASTPTHSMKRIRNLPLLTLACLLGASAMVLAAPIPVNNASFERPMLDSGGWSNDLPDPDLVDGGPDWIGQNGPNDGNTFIEFIPNFNSEGNQHLGMQGNYYVFQNTGVAWLANSGYTLTVGVGNRGEPAGALTIIGLTSSAEAPGPDNTLPYNNANAFLDDPLYISGAGMTVDSGANDALSFTDYTVSFVTGDVPPPGNIVIFLGDEGTADRSHFDNVRLDVVGGGPDLPIPVAHFPLDEDGNSPEAGGFIASTVDESVTFGTVGANGNTGNSASFDGSGIIQHDWNTQLNPESFTLTLWAKSDGGAGAWNSPVTSRHDLNGEGETSQGYLIYDNEPGGVWTFWSGNGPDAGNWQILDGPAVMLGEWEHLAITYDDATETKKLYLNGELVVEANDSLFPNDTMPFSIGGGGDFGADFRFIGDIDDIGLWDVVLNDNEILLAMESGVNAFFSGGGGVNPLDPDGDGIFTPLEEKHGLDPNVADADSDNDGDGVIASVEIFELGTLANNPDTDGDGLSDGVETNTGNYVDATNTGTNPKSDDTDGDGLKDGTEVPDADPPGTSPVTSDTDGDGTDDGKELIAGTNPLDANSKPAFPIPIGYWPFDDQGSTETADLGPAGYVSNVNGDPDWVAGHSGNANDFAIKFDGEDDSVTTEVSLLNDLPELTMSFWMRMEEEQLGARIGLVGQNDAVEYGMINPGTMQWWSPAGAIDVEFGPIVEDWTHVAVVLNAEGFKVFANGEIIGENAGGGPVSSGDTLNIGGDGVFDAEGNFFLGEIDDVAIWDEALSDSQIADLANQVICPLGACGGSGFNITEVNREADGAVSLTWVSGAGNFYDIEASPNMSSGSWVSMGVVIPAEGGEALLTSATITSDAALSMEYFRVRQVDPPPFLETSFEDGLGDWTTNSVAGSMWEVGVPAAGPTAAKTGVNVAGTGLAGDYEDGTVGSLRTPVIDTLGNRVSLSFSYFLEAIEGEGGRVNLLETDGSIIQSFEPIYTGGDEGNTADWTDVSLRLPSLEPSRPFIIEFEFLTGDDGDPNNGAGWFIDDVRIGK
ncbi:MAG: hypothetical protein ACI9DF_005295 [Verrucomicrobiales bacterium]